MESALRVVQITDCHILPNVGAEIYGADTYRSLAAVLDAALSLDRVPQLVLATGDLSEDGSDASYIRLRELLLQTGVPVYVIAGNHDSHDAIQRLLIGGNIYSVDTLDLSGWRIAFLDSTVAGEPFGHLDHSELQRLENILLEDESRPVMTCLHHSPIRPCPSSGCHLRNDADLWNLLDKHANARVVLAGHSHLELERDLKHTKILTSPATSSQCWHAQLGEQVDHEDFWDSHAFDADKHGFRIVDLRPNGEFETRVQWVSAN